MLKPADFLRRANERFAREFEALDALWSQLRADGVQWPSWCRLPDQQSAARLAPLGLDREQDPIDFELAVTAYAWRRSRDVFRLGDGALRAMLKSRVEGLVGIDVLKRLPESCIYIEAPGLAGTNGFFARLDHERSGAHDHLWLRCVALGPEGALPLALRFGIGQSVDQALHHATLASVPPLTSAYAANAKSAALRDHAHAMVALVLFVSYARDDLRQELGADAEVRLWTAGWQLARDLPASGVYAGAAWQIAFAPDSGAGGFGWQAPGHGALPLRQL